MFEVILAGFVTGFNFLAYWIGAIMLSWCCLMLAGGCVGLDSYMDWLDVGDNRKTIS